MEGLNADLATVWTPGSLAGADGVAESIASEDRNNLYHTSCYLREQQRYRAFCANYAIMRVVDDRIDGFLSGPPASAEDRARELSVVETWHDMVRACLHGDTLAPLDEARTDHVRVHGLLSAFAKAAKQFPIPEQLWGDFFAAMRQDLLQRQFATYDQFLEYAAGASVAPTTIYLHLVSGESCGEAEVFRPPQHFDILQCGRALGRFAYIAHILRDLREDVMTGERPLLYLAADDMAAHGVTAESLRRDAAAETASSELRELVRELVKRASALAREGRSYLSALHGSLTDDREFVLGFIVSIYEGYLRKIASCSYDVMAERHRLTNAEKWRIAQQVAASRPILATRLRDGFV